MTWEVRSDLFETMMNKMEMEFEETEEIYDISNSLTTQEDNSAAEVPNADNEQSKRLEMEEVSLELVLGIVIIFADIKSITCKVVSIC